MLGSGVRRVGPTSAAFPLTVLPCLGVLPQIQNMATIFANYEKEIGEATLGVAVATQRILAAAGGS